MRRAFAQMLVAPISSNAIAVCRYNLVFPTKSGILLKRLQTLQGGPASAAFDPAGPVCPADLLNTMREARRLH